MRGRSTTITNGASTIPRFVDSTGTRLWPSISGVSGARDRTIAPPWTLLCNSQAARPDISSLSRSCLRSFPPQPILHHQRNKDVPRMPTIPLTLYPLSYPAATARFLAESWWTCYSSPPHTWRQRSDAILATEQPISVMPRTARNGLDPVITPAPAWKGFAPTWLGVPCHVGRVTLSLPIYLYFP